MPLRLRGGRAPFVAIATFPPFQRGNLPRRRKRSLFYLSLRGNETTAAIRWNNGRSICRVLYSKGLPRHFVPRNDNKSIVRWDILLALNMTYFLSPIGTSCHFPRRRKQKIRHSERSEESHRVSEEYIFAEIHPPGSLLRRFAFLAKTVYYACRWFGWIFRYRSI